MISRSNQKQHLVSAQFHKSVNTKLEPTIQEYGSHLARLQSLSCAYAPTIIKAASLGLPQVVFLCSSYVLRAT